MTHLLTGISSMATRAILADCAQAYEQRCGSRVEFRSMGGVEAAQKVRAGEPVDLVVLASNVMEKLEVEGHILPGSRADFARSGMAIAVPAGAPHPRIADAASVREAVLDARKICYSTGPSGEHLKRLIEKWGIGETVSSRLLQAPAGVPVGTLLAQGEADLGFQQLSELLHLPGIEIVGPLPPDIQALTVFTSGICSRSSRQDDARALIAFFSSLDMAAAKHQHGMEPVSLG